MQDNHSMSRRTAVKSSIFGLLAVSIPNIVFAKKIIESKPTQKSVDNLFPGYPSIDDKMVAEVVGASHFNLERVKELVNNRPELARATWDWAFGDWETAIGAASHVGRRDIAAFLMSKGARPDIFTFAMLGAHDAVKSMIETTPGIQSIGGPHGITLLSHAKNGLRADGLNEKNKSDSKKLINYLESLGNADLQEKYIDLTEEEQEKYLGDYIYGDGPEDGFSIKRNLRRLLSLGKLGKFGGAINQKTENVFGYNGTVSVTISFELKENIVISLTVKEPNLTLKAIKK
ncbi:MAG: hypothetical protein WAU23_09500 [Ferruginibacter sp.]